MIRIPDDPTPATYAQQMAWRVQERRDFPNVKLADLARAACSVDPQVIFDQYKKRATWYVAFKFSDGSRESYVLID